jgi:tRNA/tmRNA/rRNA uracil-C5-methylase (TrmA/RlmC/RlmD family)
MWKLEVLQTLNIFKAKVARSLRKKPKNCEKNCDRGENCENCFWFMFKRKKALKKKETWEREKCLGK